MEIYRLIFSADYISLTPHFNRYLPLRIICNINWSFLQIIFELFYKVIRFNIFYL